MDVTDNSMISYCRFQKGSKKTPDYYSFRVYQVPLEDLEDAYSLQEEQYVGEFANLTLRFDPGASIKSRWARDVMISGFVFGGIGALVIILAIVRLIDYGDCCNGNVYVSF